MTIGRKHWLDSGHLLAHHWFDGTRKFFLDRRIWAFLEFLLLTLFFLYIFVNAAH